MGIPLSKAIQYKPARIIILLALGPLCLSLAQCGAKPAPPLAPAAVPALSCSTNATCTSVTNLPYCADPLTSFCNLTFHECMYRIKNSSTCPCIERDVRTCTLPGGGTGIQECVTDNPKTRTMWNDCHSC